MIADASVVVKWYLEEEYSGEALRLRDDYISGLINIAAPELMPFEVVNAVKYSRRDVSLEKLKMIIESLSLYGFKLYRLKGEYALRTIEASVENDITIYDASYVGLAILLNTTLYTADEHLINKLKQRYRKHVKHIKDYP